MPHGPVVAVRHEHAAAVAGRLAARSPRTWPRLPSCSYPEADYRPLREAIGRYAGFDWTQVVPGAGCDEMLLMCGALAMGRGDHAIVCRPTYQMYAVVERDGGRPARGARAARRPRARLRGAARARPGRAAGLALLAQQPDRRGGVARRRGRALRVVPGPRRGRPGVRRARRRRPLRPRSPSTRTSSSAARSRRAGRSPRCGSATRSPRPAIAGALDALRPPGSISLQSAAAAELAPRARGRDARRRRGVRRRARAGCAAACEALGLEVLGRGRHVRHVPLPLDSGEAFRAARRARAASCARSATSRCSRA